MIGGSPTCKVQPLICSTIHGTNGYHWHGNVGWVMTNVLLVIPQREPISQNFQTNLLLELDPGGPG
jgi:hypothetical protein